MKKIHWLGLGLLAAIAVGLIIFFVLRMPKPPAKPPIVDHFACSDYCPEPQEQYMVKVYEGITDEDECRKLGGTPSSYVGWGTFHICLAP